MLKLGHQLRRHWRHGGLSPGQRVVAAPAGRGRDPWLAMRWSDLGQQNQPAARASQRGAVAARGWLGAAVVTSLRSMATGRCGGGRVTPHNCIGPPGSTLGCSGSWRTAAPGAAQGRSAGSEEDGGGGPSRQRGRSEELGSQLLTALIRREREKEEGRERWVHLYLRRPTIVTTTTAHLRRSR